MDDIELRSARTWDEVRRVADATLRSFKNRRSGDPFFHERMLDTPFLPLENVLVGLVEGEIATGLCINDRNLYFGGRQVYSGTIGPVFTVPEHRSEGYASRLMEYCHEFMQEKGYVLSTLSAGPGRQSFYDELGWQSIPSPAAVVDEPTPVNPGGGEWVPLDRERHAKTLCETYRKEYRSVDGMAARPLVYWTDRIFSVESGGINEWSTALWRDGDNFEGYLVWAVDEGTVTCYELGHAGAHRGAFYRDCWNRLSEAGDRVVWKPPLGDLRGDIDGAAETDVIRNCMVRVVDEDILSAIADAPLRDAGDVAEHVSRGEWYWSKV